MTHRFLKYLGLKILCRNDILSSREGLLTTSVKANSVQPGNFRGSDSNLPWTWYKFYDSAGRLAQRSGGTNNGQNTAKTHQRNETMTVLSTHHNRIDPATTKAKTFTPLWEGCVGMDYSEGRILLWLLLPLSCRL